MFDKKHLKKQIIDFVDNIEKENKRTIPDWEIPEKIVREWKSCIECIDRNSHIIERLLHKLKNKENNLNTTEESYLISDIFTSIFAIQQCIYKIKTFKLYRRKDTEEKV